MQEMSDIHDIKPLFNIGIDPLIFLYVALFFIILAVIAVLYFFLKKRRKAKKNETPPMSPYEMALKLLSEIENLDDIREFYFRLSLILRAYIEAKFQINAIEMTTEELSPKILDLNIDKNLKTYLKELLYSSDYIKFAKYTTDKTKMNSDLNFVKEFVTKT
ncbi:MAG: hypothetical protein HQK79_16090 [Desulfobacterales bacterium]|nr:hypothetical protein [Desulfobacterales bacterium]MBF0397631.1 hypothetical protein [Desulfobacterales bacterium]